MTIKTKVYISFHLNKASRSQFLCVNDEFWSVPKSQGVAHEDDAPQVSLKHSYDWAFLHSPVLSFDEVSVVPVRCYMLVLFQMMIVSSVKYTKAPFNFLFFSAESGDCSDGWQDFISHGSCLGVGLQFSSRQSGHSLPDQRAALKNAENYSTVEKFLFLPWPSVQQLSQSAGLLLWPPASASSPR